MAPTEQAMLADTFPSRLRGGQAFALYGVAVIVAPTVGPAWALAYGQICPHWIFALINGPLVCLRLLLVQ